MPVAPGSAELLPGSWRRWQQAFDAYDSGDEAETFQTVGVRLRECLVSFLGETTSDELVPEGTPRPKGADFRAWIELLANTLAAGESAAKLRSYLKKLAVETWEYVNWLTHHLGLSRRDSPRSSSSEQRPPASRLGQRRTEQVNPLSPTQLAADRFGYG